MAFFAYKAKTKEGTTREGVVEAPNKAQVAAILEEKELIPLSIEAQEKNKGQFLNLSFINQVKAKDVAIFSRQLSVMVSANMPIVQALKIMAGQTESEQLQDIITDVADEVEGGAQLSQALSRYPKVFDNFFVSMIKSGETSGKLDDILVYLADQREKDYDLMNKIRGAMIYPAFIVVGLVVVGIVMMVFVVPKLTSVLTELGGDLPLSTKVLIGVSGFMVKSWWILLLVLAIATVLLRKALKTEKGKHYWGWAKLKIPIFGMLFKRIYLVRVTRSMSTLLTGGVPLTQALGIASEVVSNPVYQELINRTIKEVEDGHSIVSVFDQSEHMPKMVTHMMGVGEQTGKLDQILDKLTDFYTREIDNLVANMVSLIEPIIMVVMGVAVGMMVAAIIMPMYNMASGF